MNRHSLLCVDRPGSLRYWHRRRGARTCQELDGRFLDSWTNAGTSGHQKAPPRQWAWILEAQLFSGATHRRDVNLFSFGYRCRPRFCVIQVMADVYV